VVNAVQVKFQPFGGIVTVFGALGVSQALAEWQEPRASVLGRELRTHWLIRPAPLHHFEQRIIPAGCCWTRRPHRPVKSTVMSHSLLWKWRPAAAPGASRLRGLLMAKPKEVRSSLYFPSPTFKNRSNEKMWPVESPI